MNRMLAIFALAIGATACITFAGGGHGGGHGISSGRGPAISGSAGRSMGSGPAISGARTQGARMSGVQRSTRTISTRHATMGTHAPAKVSTQPRVKRLDRANIRDAQVNKAAMRIDGRHDRHKHGPYWRHHRRWYSGDFYLVAGWDGIFPWWWDRRVCIGPMGFEVPFEFCSDNPYNHYWWYR